MKNFSAREIFESEKNSVYVFNVGQGEHIMFQFDKMTYGIIDFFYDPTLGQSEPPVLTYFKRLNNELDEKDFMKIQIAFICISHPHHDHLKGIYRTLKWIWSKKIPIHNFWVSPVKGNEELKKFIVQNIKRIEKELSFRIIKNNNKKIESYKKDMTALFDGIYEWEKGNCDDKGKGINRSVTVVNDIKLLEGKLIENTKIYSLGPLYRHIDQVENSSIIKLFTWLLSRPKIDTKELYLDIDAKESGIRYNDISHLILLKQKMLNLLFTGDSSYRIILDCLNEFDNKGFKEESIKDYESDLVKIPHHGASSELTEEVLQRLRKIDKTCYYSISCGYKNKYSHPRPETISDIKKVSREPDNLFTTSMCGKAIKALGLEGELWRWYNDDKDKSVEYRELTKNYRKTKVGKDKNKDELGLLAFKFTSLGGTADKIDVSVIFATSIPNNDECCLAKYNHLLCDQVQR